MNEKKLKAKQYMLKYKRKKKAGMKKSKNEVRNYETYNKEKKRERKKGNLMKEKA